MPTQSETNLENLVKEAQAGNHDSFRAIFERLSGKLFLYASSRTRGREAAMDIVQESFIDLWKSLGKLEYRSEEAFHGFVFTIIKRKLTRHYQTEINTFPLEEQKEKSCEPEMEDWRYLLCQINDLAVKYQDILRLRYWSDMTFSEIANTLNIKETTAKTWHRRAVQKLKINFGKIDYAI